MNTPLSIRNIINITLFEEMELIWLTFIYYHSDNGPLGNKYQLLSDEHQKVWNQYMKEQSVYSKQYISVYVDSHYHLRFR